ncbi:MAG: Zn-dependent hydrolase [Flavobacteriales bacterium]|nr:Zn-dependent hydrolase [Flavobacteriales bacterium]
MNTFYKSTLLAFAISGASLQSCNTDVEKKEVKTESTKENSMLKDELNKYVPFKLTTNISHLSSNQQKMLSKLFEVADIMNKLYKYEVLDNSDNKYAALDTQVEKDLFKINYGPWNRLDGNKPFTSGEEAKPAGANFYPVDMTKEEFENWDNKDKEGQYSFVRRDDSGKLILIPYHIMFEKDIKKASELILEASELADSKDFKKYLQLRSKALLTDDYYESDMAWMSMKDNDIDFVVGPIENYEDQLFGFRAAHESFILVKDLEWSDKLKKFAKFLPELQKGLPVEAKYKAETPGTDSDLGAYDVVFYAGDCNAGSKTIAINLPNDERVQLAKGSRRLQLKNAMKAKFDNILISITGVLIDESQRKHVKFDAFFENTMFHEVAHGLGIKQTLEGNESVRKALKEKYSALEEGKADILGLYMVDQLIKKGELDADIKDNMVTFMAGIFRSIRFGASSAHGKANLLRFNYFKEAGAFTQNTDGTYVVNFGKMEEAMNSLSDLILRIQGDGNYEAVTKLMDEKGKIGPDLKKSLDKLSEAKIPVDVTWIQGPDALGL